MTETQLKNNVLKMIRKEFGSIVWVYKPHDMITSGIPDLLMCVAGQFVAIELKKDASCKATKLQDWTILSINQAYGKGYVCRSIDEVRKIIQEVLRGKE